VTENENTQGAVPETPATEPEKEEITPSPKATGEAPTATGETTTATGETPAATGETTTATGETTTATGEAPTSTGAAPPAPAEAPAATGETPTATGAAPPAPAETPTATGEAPAPEEEAPKVPYTLKETKEEEGSVLRFHVEGQRDWFDNKLEVILKDLRKTVVMDGFRPGKAPIQLLKNRYGKDAQKDALDEMAANIGRQLVAAESLDAISEPALHDSKVEEGKPIALEIDIEVRPKIDVKDYTGREYQVEVQPVTEDLVTQQLAHIQEANATYEAPADAAKPFEKGNGANVDIQVTDAHGQPMKSLCRENAFLRDPFVNLMPEVAQELVGKKAGETFTRAVKRTVRNRHGEEVVHEDTYTVALKEVKVRNLPALDDEFAKDLGDFKTLEDLRKRIRKDLEEQAENQKRSAAMKKIFDHLIEANPFAAPRTIVAAQEYQTIMRDSHQLQRAGMSFSDIGVSTEGYLREARFNSERFVKINLLVNAIATKEKLEASDADLEKEIAKRAESEGRKPLAIRARLEADKKLDTVKRELLVDKVEEFLMEKNTIQVQEMKKEAEK
jgi:trigger factor